MEAKTILDAVKRLTIFEMISCLSSAMDLVSPAVVSHQKRVACIACGLAQELGLTLAERTSLLYAGMLHDCGALSLQSKLDALRFDFDLKNPHQHAEVGYAFLREFEAFFPQLAQAELSTLVRFHHVSWDHGRGREFMNRPVPLGSHLLHLADRVDVLIRQGEEILGQAEGIVNTVAEQGNRLFAPELVEVFRGLAARESFWLDLTHPEAIQACLAEESQATDPGRLDVDSLLSLAKAFAHLVDFRSRYTAIHSSGVASVAAGLAGTMGFSDEEKYLISVAGYMHDLGKLAVPTEVLDKPGPLSQSEFNLIKAHPFHAYRLLAPLKELGPVVGWAALHHETLDGQGYPFHHGPGDLSLGDRIIAVSDVFTALAEDRPYRPGLAIKDAVGILIDLAVQGKLDPMVVSLVSEQRLEIDDYRSQGQAQGMAAYQQVRPYM